MYLKQISMGFVTKGLLALVWDKMHLWFCKTEVTWPTQTGKKSLTHIHTIVFV